MVLSRVMVIMMLQHSKGGVIGYAQTQSVSVTIFTFTLIMVIIPVCMYKLLVSDSHYTMTTRMHKLAHRSYTALLSSPYRACQHLNGYNSSQHTDPPNS